MHRLNCLTEMTDGTAATMSLKSARHAAKARSRERSHAIGVERFLIGARKRA